MIFTWESPQRLNDIFHPRFVQKIETFRYSRDIFIQSGGIGFPLICTAAGPGHCKALRHMKVLPFWSKVFIV